MNEGDYLKYFPFDAYNIQKDLMREVTGVLDRGGVGIFESPTGTGKSLSVICSTLSWLKNNPIHVPEKEKKGEKVDDDMPSWVEDFESPVEQHFKDKREELERVWKERMEKLRRDGPRRKRRRKMDDDKLDENSATLQSDEEFMICDEDPDNFVDEDEESSDDEDVPDLSVRKIIYCSRTHSQISQFVKEIRSTEFGKFNDSVRIRNAALASRRNLCINDSVRLNSTDGSLRSAGAISERCLELKRSSNHDCPHFDPGPQKLFRDTSLAEIHDIEDLARLGQKLGSCPYYGVRKAIPLAELVTVPYSMLLHSRMRKMLSIPLEGNVVVFDEAHNIVDAVNDTHTYTTSFSDVQDAIGPIERYFSRYRKRLKGRNRAHISRLRFALKRLEIFLSSKMKKSIDNKNNNNNNTNEEIFPMVEFLASLGIDNINMFELSDYVEQSLLLRKLQGFVEKYDEDGKKRQEKHGGSSSTPHLSLGVGRTAYEFLFALMGSDKDSRVLVKHNDDENGEGKRRVFISVISLNAGAHFKDIVDKAHAVILVGGTLRPMSELQAQLCPHLAHNVTTFACGHVVPPSNLSCLVVSTGPSGSAMNFSFSNRRARHKHLSTELFGTLRNVCTVVPQGVVCFLPSFRYAKNLRTQWEQSGQLLQIRKKKKIFWEPRNASDVETTLDLYSKAAIDQDGSGAILFCVVGAKMSEGINFANGLARCVVMVGLPFAPPSSAELKERMKWLDSRPNHVFSSSSSSSSSSPGQQYYVNLCMRAVNQSIGRAIRHINDYACILLVDERFGQSRIQSKLPPWIRDRTVIPQRFGQCVGIVAKFFREKKR